MNPVAIQYIWQAIQKSERSDDLPFIDALVRRVPSARSEETDRVSITAVVADPLHVNDDSLPAVTWPG
jgi:hypothetical protein